MTDVKCKAAKPQARSYKLFDGGGLYLEVMPSGSKLWRLKYYFLGKEKRVSLGAYPLVSLSEARDAREGMKEAAGATAKYVPIHNGIFMGGMAFLARLFAAERRRISRTAMT